MLLMPSLHVYSCEHVQRKGKKATELVTNNANRFNQTQLQCFFSQMHRKADRQMQLISMPFHVIGQVIELMNFRTPCRVLVVL